MFETRRINAGNECFMAIKDEIAKLRSEFDGTITVALPSSTSTVFFKKQLEYEFTGMFGVRFYSHDDIISLIQDRSSNELVFHKSNHVSNIIDLKTVSDEVFKEESSWLKISVIESTLTKLNGINAKQFELLENINPIAYDIAKTYLKIRESSLENFADYSNLDQIFGKMIVVYHESIPGLQEKLISKCDELICAAFEIRINKELKLSNKSRFNDSFDEMNAVLDLALSEAEKTSLSKMAIVVPNDYTKQLLIALAKSKGIPLAGADIYSAFNEQLILAARHILNNKYSLINEYFSKEFFARFPWLSSDNPTIDLNNLITLFKNIYLSETLKDYFSHISQFLQSGFKQIVKDLSEENTELIESQYSLLSQLSEEDIKISPSEAEYLLQRLCASITKRLETLGNGIYLCRPTEILGSCFETIFVTNMNVDYLKEEIENNTVLNLFELESLGLEISDSRRTRQVNESIMNWLFNCSENYFLSTSKIDSQGKALLLDLDFEEHFSDTEIDHSKTFSKIYVGHPGKIEGQIAFLEKFFATELNTFNLRIRANAVSTFNASSIDLLAKCPFKFFVTKVLKSSEIVESDNIDLIAAMERGSIIHAALEKVGLDKFDLDNVSMFVNEKIAELVKESVLPNSSSAMVNKIEVTDLIETCLELHQQKLNLGSKVYLVEEKVAGEIETENGNIKFVGKVDRIDINADGTFSIVDYKTGALQQKYDFFDFGNRLQLGVYALLLEEKLNTETLEYWYLRKNPDKIIESVQFNEENIEYIKRMVDAITSVMTNGVVAPRTYSFSQDLLKTKIADIKEIDNCSNCEVKNICYKEHQELWSSAKLKNLTEKYREATGDIDIEVSQ